MVGLLRCKRSKGLSRLAFLKRCRDTNILPNCVKLKYHKKEKSVNRILRKAGFSLLRYEISEVRRILHDLDSKLRDVERAVAEIVSQEDWDTVDRITRRKAERVYRLSTENLIKKFRNLQSNTISSEMMARSSVGVTEGEVSYDGRSQAVINLLPDPVDTPTRSLLSKGLNFAIPPKRIPVEEIICAVELAVKDMPHTRAEEIRQDVAVTLRKSKLPRYNLSREEREALRKLKMDETRLVLPADKGNATVIMTTELYNEKISQMLEEGPYKVIRNPTKKINALVSGLIKAIPDLDDYSKKALLNSDPIPPRLYGLPKIHKEGVPLRPIVCSINSATYKVSKYIAKRLGEHVGKTSSFIKDSKHFVGLVKSLRLTEGDMLVSFDVESLFTKVPIPETSAIIKDILDPKWAEIAEVCLRSTYFLFNGKFYEQTEGAAMGSPLSPVAANLYMESYERRALDTAQLKPSIWYRYVDDVWAVWPHGAETLTSFLDHLNGVHPNIKFTMEVEKDGSLPFLDVMTTRKPDGTLGHAVYRKPTHTNRYLNAGSYHHPAQKYGVLNTLVNRAINISDDDSWGKEKHVLTKVLRQNGFTKTQINRAFSKQLGRSNSNQRRDLRIEEEERRVYLPYLPGTTDKIGRILKAHNIKPVFKPGRKVRELLRPLKDKLPLSTPGVYKIPCSCGAVYVGETKRTVSTRMKEHMRHTRNCEMEKSAIAEHSCRTSHQILFDQTTVIARVHHYRARLIRESIEIMKNNNNFNRDDSYKLPTVWKPVITKYSK